MFYDNFLENCFFLAVTQQRASNINATKRPTYQ